MEDLYVLQTQSVPAAFLQAAHSPFHLLVYHLPPPPPGFLYAFTCGPTSFLQPPFIASVADPSLPSFPPPSTAPVVSASTNEVQLHSEAHTSFSQHQLGHRCASDAADSQACTPFWSTKEKGFPRIYLPIEKKNSAQQEQTDSTCTSQITPDDAIQENKRFNKTPSFRVKKFVRTNSRNSCVPETTKKLESAASSSYRSSLPADQLVQYSPPTSKVQHRITEHWRVRAKPKDFQGPESTSDMKCSPDAGDVCCNANVGELNKLMGSFSFGLNSRMPLVKRREEDGLIIGDTSRKEE